MAAAVASAVVLLASRLTVDFMQSPLALGHANPLFQFVPQLQAANEDARNATLLASRLQVSVNASFDSLACDIIQQGSANCARCSPADLDFSPDTLVYWRVALSAADGIFGPWSTSWYGTGFVQGSDIAAKWIIANAGLSALPSMPPVRCRAVLRGSTLPNAVQRATIFLSSPGYYQLSSNGQRLDDKMAVGPQMQFTQRVAVEAWDVTSLLQSRAQGSDVSVGVRIGGSAYSEFPWLWNNSTGWPLLMQVHVDDTSGKRSVFATGAPVQPLSFTCHSDSVLSSPWYGPEAIDGRIEAALQGWDSPTYQPDGTWVPAQLAVPSAMPAQAGYISVINATLTMHDWPAVKPWGPAVLHPARLYTASDGSQVFDMGQNAAIQLQLSLPSEVPAGMTITLACGELTHPENGTVWNPLTAGWIVGMNVSYITNGLGNEVFGTEFVFFGAQYCGVYGLPPGLNLSVASLQAFPISTEAPTVSSIAFDGVQPSLEVAQTVFGLTPADDSPWLPVDAPLNSRILAAVQHSILWSARSNFQSIPSDCPNREKRGWMGDAAVANRALMWNFDLQAAYRAWLRSMADSQAFNAKSIPGSIGLLQVMVPQSAMPSTDIAWVAALTEIMTNSWRHNLDFDIVADNYGTAYTLVMGFLQRHRNASVGGLTIDQALYGDWDAQFPRSQYSPNTKVMCAVGAHMIMAQQMIPMAAALNRSADVEYLTSLLASSQPAYNNYFAQFNRTTGILMYGDGVEQTNAVLPLTLEFVPDEYRAGVEGWLLHDLEVTQNLHLSTGATGTRFLLYALTNMGRTDLAATLAAQTSMPSWGYWSINGGTSLWENWSGIADDTHPPAPTHNHIFLGSHGGWLYETLLGLDQANNTFGWSHPVVTPPVMNTLPTMSGWLASVAGNITVAWAWLDRTNPAGAGVGFQLNVTVPISTFMSTRIPVGGLSSPVVTDSGLGQPVTVWTDGAYQPNAAPGIVNAQLVSIGPAGHQQQYLELTLAQGSYALQAVQPASVLAAVEVHDCSSLLRQPDRGVRLECPSGMRIGKIRRAGWVPSVDDTLQYRENPKSVAMQRSFVGTHALQAACVGAGVSCTATYAHLDRQLGAAQLLGTNSSLYLRAGEPAFCASAVCIA